MRGIIKAKGRTGEDGKSEELRDHPKRAPHTPLVGANLHQVVAQRALSQVLLLVLHLHLHAPHQLVLLAAVAPTNSSNQKRLKVYHSSLAHLYLTPHSFNLPNYTQFLLISDSIPLCVFLVGYYYDPRLNRYFKIDPFRPRPVAALPPTPVATDTPSPAATKRHHTIASLIARRESALLSVVDFRR